MSFFKSKKNTNRRINKKGFTSYDDVYAILKDNIDESSEFYELEQAKVLKVFLDASDPDFPTTDGPEDIGRIPDWSFLGTIKARFLESQSEGDEISGYIKPLSPHIISYPVVGEIVNVALHGGQKYYYNPLNLKNKVNLNLADGETGDGIVNEESTEFNRSILGEHGDLIINGRFGNAIKFGSDPSYQYPDIKITNNQSAPDEKKYDNHYPHVQNLNSDGSSIFISSGAIRKIDQIVPAAINLTTPEILDGDMITLNSDKLVFNAKGNDSDGDIHMFADNNINITANEEINFQIGEFSLGGKITFLDPDSDNPLLKGRQTVELFFEMFKNLDSFCNTVSSATGIEQVAVAAETLRSELILTKIAYMPPIVRKLQFGKRLKKLTR